MDYRKMYSSPRWRRLRANFLTENPLCVMCQQVGRVTPATIVDHIVPHKGKPELMWDVSNLQTLCKTHHDSTKQSIDRTGRMKGCDLSGEPIDKNHHWNQ